MGGAHRLQDRAVGAGLIDVRDVWRGAGENSLTIKKAIEFKLPKPDRQSSRSGYSLAVRSGHQVLISKWLQVAGRNDETIHILLKVW